MALALVKPEGFGGSRPRAGLYTAEIVYPVDRERYLLRRRGSCRPRTRRVLGFHYTPYNFDSLPEKSFFQSRCCPTLNVRPEEVEDLYFTGALTDPAKTDFFVEYKDDKGKWRRYTPDFVLRRKGGTAGGSHRGDQGRALGAGGEG